MCWLEGLQGHAVGLERRQAPSHSGPQWHHHRPLLQPQPLLALCCFRTLHQDLGKVLPIFFVAFCFFYGSSRMEKAWLIIIWGLNISCVWFIKTSRGLTIGLANTVTNTLHWHSAFTWNQLQFSCLIMSIAVNNFWLWFYLSDKLIPWSLSAAINLYQDLEQGNINFYVCLSSKVIDSTVSINMLNCYFILEVLFANL